MLGLRSLLQRAFPGMAAQKAGWQPGNTSHHCGWQYVVCDTQRRVTEL
jgi:hypothetical protein